MQNYIKAIRDFVKADVDFQAYTSNIEFLRITKENQERPLIIFTEMKQKNPYAWNMRTKGWDGYPVFFDIYFSQGE